QRGDGSAVGAVARAAGFDGRRVGLERRGAELANARVQLLVARAQGGDLRVVQIAARAGEELGHDPAVVRVIVPEAGEVHEGGPDVGLISPGSRGARPGNGARAAVRSSRAGSLRGAQPVEATVGHARTDKADP